MYEIMVEDEIYTIETEKETAETSQISTSEQEEKQTFVITSKWVNFWSLRNMQTSLIMHKMTQTDDDSIFSAADESWKLT